MYAQKRAALLNNHTKKIGAGNTFHTLLDMSNISFPGFDSTKSLASAAYRENEQKYYHIAEGKSLYFKDLKEIPDRHIPGEKWEGVGTP